MRAERLLLATILLVFAAGQAQAAVVYTVEFSGVELYDTSGNDLMEVFGGTFTIDTASPITTAGLFPISSGSLDANAAVYYHLDSVQEFDPNGFGTGLSFVGVRTVNNDMSGGGTGFLFFASGSFLADGVYNAEVGTITDGMGNFYGNFARSATLTVRGVNSGSTVPEPTSLALAGFAGIGMAVGAIRRRRQQKSAAA